MEHSDEVDKCNERQRMRMRMAVLEESVRSGEVECRASRETVLRLVAELDRERKKAVSGAAALDSLKVELDGLMLGKSSVEVEKQTLTERLEASRRVAEAAQRESHCLERQVGELERKLHGSQAEARQAEEKLQRLLRKVASLIRPLEAAQANGDVENLGNKAVAELESRLRSLSEELDQQTELRLSAQQGAEQAEQQIQELQERLQRLEAELLTADTLQDELRLHNQHYEEFLDELSEVMKVDTIAVDLGLDMRMKLIVGRAEQLAKHEGTALAESKSLTFSLQRKLKVQKEQLDSKGLHLQLVRKKLSELEEERRSRSALATEREGGRLEAQQRLERLQVELRAARRANGQLRAQLSLSSQLKLRVEEQSQSMMVQEQEKKKLSRLLQGKARAERKLSALTSDLQSQERKSEEDERQMDTLRKSRDQLAARERELADFRTAVAQMLGVDATTNPSLQNHDIIRQLETILHANHHLHHHVSASWLCPTHRRSAFPHIQDLNSDLPTLVTPGDAH